MHSRHGLSHVKSQPFHDERLPVWESDSNWQEGRVYCVVSERAQHLFWHGYWSHLGQAGPGIIGYMGSAASFMMTHRSWKNYKRAWVDRDKPRNLEFNLLLWMDNGSWLPTGPLTITKNISLIMFSLNMLDSSMFSLLLTTYLCCAGRGCHTESLLLFEFSC